MNDCRFEQSFSRRDVLGCSRKEKNGSTTSKRKTAIVQKVLLQNFQENKYKNTRYAKKMPFPLRR